MLIAAHTPKVGGTKVLRFFNRLYNQHEMGNAYELLSKSKTPCAAAAGYSFISDEMSYKAGLALKSMLQPCYDVSELTFFRDPIK